MEYTLRASAFISFCLWNFSCFLSLMFFNAKTCFIFQWLLVLLLASTERLLHFCKYNLSSTGTKIQLSRYAHASAYSAFKHDCLYSEWLFICTWLQLQGCTIFTCIHINTGAHNMNKGWRMHTPKSSHTLHPSHVHQL